MRLFADRLGPKLNLFLLGFVVVLGAATAALVIAGFQRTQDDATRSSREGLEEQAQTTLAGSASQYAAFGQAQLEATAGFAQQASRYFVDVSGASPPPPFDLSRLNTNPSGVIYDGTPGRRLDVFLPAGTEIDDAVVRDLTDSSVLDQLLPALLEGFTATTRSSDYDAIAIYFQSVNHVTRMYPPVPDITALPPSPDLQPSLDVAGPEQNPGRVTYWSTPYQDVAGRGLVMTALVPVYEGEEYRGAIGVDLSLNRLIAQINDVRPSPSGFAFYLDRDGNLLPTQRAADVEAEIDDPRNPSFAALITDMRAGRQAVGRAEIGGDEVFVAYVPLQGVGGNLAIVAPVDELTQQAAAVEQAIDDGGRRTLLFALGAMGVVCLAGLLAASYLNRRLILNPIAELVLGTRNIAAGDLQASIPVRSSDELGALAESFNGMTTVLRQRTDALRASEAELSALFRSMTDVVVRVNREGRFLSIAPTSQPDLVGAASAFVGKTLYDAYPKDQADRMLEPVIRALDTGQPQSMEYPTTYPAGERWFAASISAMSDDEAVIVSRDITDRRKKEEELREREEQYRSTFESTSDGIIITRLDDGRIIDVNPAFCDMHGYSREEMMALHPTHFIHPDDHHLFVDYIATVAAGGEYRCRARDIRKDGTLFHVEVLGTPVTYNGMRHILGVVRDITETVHAEQVLERRVDERTTELSALLHVSQTVASTLDIKHVARSILEELAGVARYTGATLISVEGDDLVIVDSWGPFQDDVLQGPTARFPRRAIPEEFWHTMENGVPVFIDDVRDDSLLARSYRRVFRPFLDLPSFRNIRSWIAVPLVRQGQIAGMLAASHDEPSFFTEDNARLIVAAASQATVAMENARLFQETQEHTRELETLLDVSTNVASTIKLEPLLNLILEQVRAVAPYHRSGFLVLNGAELEVLAVRARPGEVDEQYERHVGMRLPATGAPLWERVTHGETIIIDDVHGESEDARLYRQAVGPELDTTFRDIKGWMAIPLMLGDRPIGVLTLASDQRGFYTPQHARLARAVADQAAVAIENARLFEQTERRRRESAALLEISQSLTSTLELSQLVRVILAQLGTVVDYTGSSVVLVRGDELEILSSRIIDPPNTPEIRGLRFPLVRDSETWRRLERLETIVIDDIHGDDVFAREYRATIGEEALKTPSFAKIRSWMGVPLGIKGRIIGTLSMSRSEPGYFTEDHARIAAAVGKQAALAIENARLFEEAAERTSELQTLLDVSTNVASTIELEPLLNLILEQVRMVAPYDGATFFILHGERLRAEAYLTMPDDSLDLTTMGMELPTKGLRLWDLVGRGLPLIIDDVLGDSEGAHAYREAAGPMLTTRFRRVRSWLGVPLMIGDRAVGVLALSGHRPGVFTDQHGRLTRAVADQSALAVENARLFGEASQRARETEALLRADAELFRSLSLDDVFQALCDVAVDVLGVDKCMVTTIEDELGRYTVRASRNLAQDSLARMAEVRRTTPRVRLATMEEPIIHTDAQDAMPEMREIFAAEGIVSTMDVPIRIEGVVRGDFAIGRTTGHAPDEREIRLFQALADRASIAIQNAELFERAQQAASLEERQRLARELHDSVSQALYGIALGARTARTQLDRDPSKATEPVEYVLSLAEAGLAEMRALIFELRPESLQTEGLVAAIEKHIASTRARYSLDVTADLCPEPQVSIEVKEALYRVAQEALHNVVKHAHAHKVDVRLCSDNGAVELDVQDDGRGFDPAASYPGHVGLHSMRERIEKLRGSIAIESAAGNGSSVRARIPIPNGR